MINGVRRASQCRSAVCGSIVFFCRKPSTASYTTAAIPPNANENMKLSISNPVLVARLNNEGGCQYSGTKIGSVNPKGVVSKLDHSICLRTCGLMMNNNSQNVRKPNDATSHSFMFFYESIKV